MKNNIPNTIKQYVSVDHKLSIYNDQLYIITYSEIINYHNNNWKILFEDDESKGYRWYPFDSVFANNYIGISPDDGTDRFFYFNLSTKRIIKDSDLLQSYADTDKYEYINSFIFDRENVSILFILRNKDKSKMNEYLYIIINNSKKIF